MNCLSIYIKLVGVFLEFSNRADFASISTPVLCKMRRKFHNLSRENSLNQIWNNRRKCRISKWIQRSSIEHSHWSENGRKTRKEDDIWKKNLENLHKISQFVSNKLTESDRKWQKKMQNFKTNSTKFDWRFNWRCKWEKTSNVTHPEKTPHIGRVLFKIEIHWKSRLNTSFDAEFNALKEYLILTEKID